MFKDGEFNPVVSKHMFEFDYMDSVSTNRRKSNRNYWINNEYSFCRCISTTLGKTCWRVRTFKALPKQPAPPSWASLKKSLRRRGFQYGQEIAIANDAGKYYAVANKLPPTSQPATFGEILGGGKLKEPITGTTFDMRTGARHICALIISGSSLWEGVNIPGLCFICWWANLFSAGDCT